MSRIVGVTAHCGLSSTTRAQVERAQAAALRHFPWLEERVEQLGDLTLSYWGVDVERRRIAIADQVVIVVGSPAGKLDEQALGRIVASEPIGSQGAWSGRVVIVRAAADGTRFRVATDWLGSIPVYRVESDRRMMVSTLEPVAAAASAEKQLSMEGLASLLVNGHFEGQWTLTADMSTVAPDSQAEWQGRWGRARRRHTVVPSSERLEASWSDLIEELHHLTQTVCQQALAHSGLHIIPLSSGMDSRLMAAVAKEQEVEVRLATYGLPDDIDVVCARQVARCLGLPWRFIDLRTDFLTDFTGLWADWFGSSMHFHGMYQMPFLTALAGEPPAPLVHGYMGDPLAGNHIAQLDAGHGLESEGSPLAPNWQVWSRHEVEALVREPLGNAFGNVLAARREVANSIPGPRYKRLMLLDALIRQRLLISYQPIMYDYWRGVTTPFLLAEYARFWLSLPRAALDDRRLQKDLLVNHYPELASIAGTFATSPLRPTRSYVLRRALGARLPVRLRRGPFREFHFPHRSLDMLALQRGGSAALWPLFETRSELGEVVDLSIVDATAAAAFGGDGGAQIKLSALQALALWLRR